MLEYEKPQHLTFTYPIEEIQVQRDSELFHFTLVLPAGRQISEYDTIFKEIRKEIKSVHDMTGLSGSQMSEGLKLILTDANHHVTEIKTSLELINKYHDPQVVAMDKHNCQLTLTEGLTVENLNLALSEIQNRRRGLSLSWTSAEINEPIKAAALFTFAYDTRDQLYQIAEDLSMFLVYLDNLISNKIPNDILVIMQGAPCYPDAFQESVQLKYCKKHRDGLGCNFAVEIYKTVESFYKLQPINYDGIELSIGSPSEILVKTIATQELGTLHCADVNSKENYNCIYSSWDNDCSAGLLADDYEQVLQSCNFTKQKPISPIRTLDKGLLIMDKSSKIKVLDAKHRILPNKAPMLILSKDPIVITQGHQEQKFLPDSQNINFTIVYSNLNQTIKNKMQRKAKIQHVVNNLEWAEIIGYVMFIAQLTMIPVTCFNFFWVLKNKQTFAPIQKILRKKTSSNKAINKKANYKINQKYVQAQQFDTTSV